MYQIWVCVYAINSINSNQIETTNLTLLTGIQSWSTRKRWIEAFRNRNIWHAGTRFIGPRASGSRHLRLIGMHFLGDTSLCRITILKVEPQAVHRPTKCNLTCIQVALVIFVTLKHHDRKTETCIELKIKWKALVLLHTTWFWNIEHSRVIFILSWNGLKGAKCTKHPFRSPRTTDIKRALTDHRYTRGLCRPLTHRGLELTTDIQGN